MRAKPESIRSLFLKCAVILAVVFTAHYFYYQHSQPQAAYTGSFEFTRSSDFQFWLIVSLVGALAVAFLVDTIGRIGSLAVAALGFYLWYAGYLIF